MTEILQAQEVEETMKRIQSHKGVVGTIVVNSEGKFTFLYFTVTCNYSQN